MKIAILGAGMVGRAMALDLAAQHDLTSFDISESNLSTLKGRNRNIKTQIVTLRISVHTLIFSNHLTWP
jgi:malate/lactate dehydrogenase